MLSLQNFLKKSILKHKSFRQQTEEQEEKIGRFIDLTKESYANTFNCTLISDDKCNGKFSASVILCSCDYYLRYNGIFRD